MEAFYAVLPVFLLIAVGAAVHMTDVLPMLRSIVQPAYYHQVCNVFVTAQRGQSSKRVELWRSGELLRAMYESMN